MEPSKKRKTLAAVLSLCIHAALIALLAILTLTAAERDPQDEDGIPVLLGEAGNTNDWGAPQQPSQPAEPEPSSDDSEQPEDPAISEPSEPSKPAPPAKPVITQTDEATIAAQKAREEAERKEKAEAERKAKAEAERKAKAEAEKKAKAEAERKAREEAERKKAEAERKAREEAERKKAEAARKAAEEKARQEAAAAAASSRVSGAFGGKSGSPTGNANQGAPTGVGGTGTAQAKVGSRRVVYLATPNYADQTSEGQVVVSIVVNSAGRVTSASIQSATTTSTALRNAAIAAARQSTFSAGENNAEAGTITYRFKLK